MEIGSATRPVATNPNPCHTPNQGSPTTTTQLKIDENLIEEARRLGQHKTREAAVTAALEHYIQHRKQLEILDLFGTIDYHEDYDYKKNRQLDRIEIDPEIDL